MGELPAGLPPHLVKTIHAGLLRAHSKRLEKAKRDFCLREVYDVFASTLRDDGYPMTDECLREQIPAWVLQWARAKKWLGPPMQANSEYSPVRFVDDPRPSQPEFILVPDHELTVQFGECRVTENYKIDFIKILESRIVYWQAEALSPSRAQHQITPTTDTESISDALSRLRIESRLTIEELARRVSIDQRSVERHLSGKTIPRIGHIGAYERVFSNILKTKVVLPKMPVKRR